MLWWIADPNRVVTASASLQRLLRIPEVMPNAYKMVEISGTPLTWESSGAVREVVAVTKSIVVPDTALRLPGGPEVWGGRAEVIGLPNRDMIVQFRRPLVVGFPKIRALSGLTQAPQICGISDMGQAALTLAGPGGSPLALVELVDRFGRYLSARKRSADTQQRYRSAILDLAQARGWTTADQLDAAGISAWLETFSGKTYNNKLAAVRTFCRWLQRVERAVTVNPAKDLERSTETPEEGMREFTLDEMRRIVAAADGRRRGAYIIAATTGLRKGCICRGLRRRHVDLEQGIIEIPPKEIKNRRKLTIPLTLEALQVLQHACDGLAPDDHAFPFFVDNRTLHADMAAAGVPRRDARGRPAAWHSFRKGFLSALAEAGVHPKVAQELVGHSDVRLTMNSYTRMRADTLRAAVDGLWISGGFGKELAEPRGVGTICPSQARGSQTMDSARQPTQAFTGRGENPAGRDASAGRGSPSDHPFKRPHGDLNPEGRADGIGPHNRISLSSSGVGASAPVPDSPVASVQPPPCAGAGQLPAPAILRDGVARLSRAASLRSVPGRMVPGEIPGQGAARARDQRRAGSRQGDHQPRHETRPGTGHDSGHNSGVEQRIARVAHNHEVAGSNPAPAITPPARGGSAHELNTSSGEKAAGPGHSPIEGRAGGDAPSQPEKDGRNRASNVGRADDDSRASLGTAHGQFTARPRGVTAGRDPHPDIHGGAAQDVAAAGTDAGRPPIAPVPPLVALAPVERLSRAERTEMARLLLKLLAGVAVVGGLVAAAAAAAEPEPGPHRPNPPRQLTLLP